MFIIDSYAVAVIFCFITMLCWGSWGNTEKLAIKSWPYQLYYWDYTIGVLLFSLIFGLTLGTIGSEGRSFFADLAQADWSALGSAFLGGVVFNLANILLVVAIDLAGMAVAFPVGIGLALVIGVFINYLASPVGDPLVLFLGVGFVTVAIILDALAYNRVEKTHSSAKGIIISILCGVLMGLFYRFVAAGVSLNYTNPEPGLMTPYGAVFIFSLGVFVSNFLWNTYFMYRPVSGEAVSYKQYFTEGTSRLHVVGILGGVIWCLGMGFNLLAPEKAGFAISYGLGQGATMVAAAWGVFIWDEFEDAPEGTNKLIWSMFLFFIVGLGLIIISRTA
ncbi:multidrug DMT transporter permease [Halalkalibaculum sp. DA3122]|uniref:multidrug DMT transporter permease n=1 Tax=Halalkalibaculum sp. DA3122 TaxID=3373607 RepID=UPI00375490E8